MSKTAHTPDDGGPAFPQFEVIAGERDGHGDIIEAYTTAAGGMSLRDWFAGQAIMAVVDAREDLPTVDAVASWCYGLADAMLAARSKAEGSTP